MATVHTATGPIDSADLGNVLVHEHVFVLGEEFRQNYQDDWDEDDKVAEAVRDLTELKELGIDTILDPTVPGRRTAFPVRHSGTGTGCRCRCRGRSPRRC